MTLSRHFQRKENTEKYQKNNLCLKTDHKIVNKLMIVRDSKNNKIIWTKISDLPKGVN